MIEREEVMENQSMEESLPKREHIEPKIVKPTDKPSTRCPDCNSILIVDYQCNKITCAWSLILLIGATCWVPCVVDGCKDAEYFCRTCDRVVYITKVTCC